MIKKILSILNSLDTRGRIVFSSIVISTFIIVFYSPIFALIFLGSTYELKNLYIDKIKILQNQLENTLIIDFDFNFYFNWIRHSVNLFEKNTQSKIYQKSFSENNNSVEFKYQNNKVYRIEVNVSNIFNSKENNFYQFFFDILVNSDNKVSLVDVFGDQNNYSPFILNDKNSNNYYEYKLKQFWNNNLLLNVTFHFFKHYNFIILIFLLLITLFFTSWSLFFNNITTNNFIFIYLNPVVILLVIINLFNFLNPLLFNYNSYLFIIYIFLGLFFFLLNYVTLLSSTILLGSTFMNLPLAGVGKTVHFILSIFTVYVYIVYIFLDMQSNSLIRVLILAILVFYYSYALMFLFNTNYLLKNINVNLHHKIDKAILNVFFIVIIFIVLVFFPTSEVYKIVMISSIFYILLSVSLEQNRNKNNNRLVILEYMFIFSLTLFSLLVSSVWGILGSIL